MPETGPDYDVDALTAYLADEFDDPVVDLEVLHDGLNLSLALSTASDEDAYILRRPNKLRHNESFLDVDEEYAVLEGLADTPIPAPAPVLLCEDDSVLGEPFLVMSHLDGEPVHLGSDLPTRFQNPPSRRRFASVLVETLADLHSVDVDPFTDVCARESIESQLDRTIDELDAATQVTGHQPPALERVADWLEANVPTDGPTTVVHGDYRPSNVLFSGTNRPEVTGVLDWETTFLGDPRTELGYLLLRWREDGDPTPSLDGIRDRHSNDEVLQDLQETNEHGLAPFTNRPGSPSRQELVAQYEETTGIAFEHERFFRAFAAFMLATVWADLHRHQVDAGQDSDWEPYVEYMARLAESVVSGELQL